VKNAAAILFGPIAGACGSFPHPSDDYACERDRDCADGRVCRSGWCVLGGRACDALGCDDFEECTEDSCQAGDCVHTPLEDGTSCGGEGTCVAAATCQAGSCQGEPQPEGQPCDDGFFCTELDACDGSGGCVGLERHCDSDGECSAGQCNEDVDACEKVPAEDYTSCSDGEVCTRNDVCQAGSCTGGAACSCDSSCDTCDGGCCDVNYLGDCGESGCSIDCGVDGCDCRYNCAGPTCRGTCESDCAVLCTAGSDCDLACAGDALCSLACSTADQCAIDCNDNAHCAVDCAGVNCNRGACPTGWIDCGGDVWACNRPCP
jgi:hypothetical protein